MLDKQRKALSDGRNLAFLFVIVLVPILALALAILSR